MGSVQLPAGNVRGGTKPPVPAFRSVWGAVGPLKILGKQLVSLGDFLTFWRFCLFLYDNVKASSPCLGQFNRTVDVQVLVPAVFTSCPGRSAPLPQGRGLGQCCPVSSGACGVSDLRHREREALTGQ